MDRFVTVKEVDTSEFSGKTNDYSESVEKKDIDSKEMKIIRDFIEKRMNSSQKMQIIDIIKNSNAKFTINKNGYFVNMNNMPNEIMYKIKMFVDFTRENARELQKTEDILNEEKSRIELIDKVDEETNNFSGGTTEVENDKNINFEIYSLDTVQSEIFEEYRENLDEENEFLSRDFASDKRENSGYKIILKRYKKKYFGYQAKVLKKFRDISRNSIISKSVKNTLNQPTTKVVSKSNVKKIVKISGGENENENLNLENELEESGVEEFTVEEEEDDESPEILYEE